MRIDAVTLATTDMSASIAFYEVLGFSTAFGGATSTFTTMSAGVCHVNLTLTIQGKRYLFTGTSSNICGSIIECYR